MIRTDYDISDEQYALETDPFYEMVDTYKEENILYPYLGFFLAHKFLMNAMWEGSLDAHIQSAIDTLCDMEKFPVKISKLNRYLKFYNVKIVKVNPLEIKELNIV